VDWACRESERRYSEERQTRRLTAGARASVEKSLHPSSRVLTRPAAAPSWDEKGIVSAGACACRRKWPSLPGAVEPVPESGPGVAANPVLSTPPPPQGGGRRSRRTECRNPCRRLPAARAARVLPGGTRDGQDQPAVRGTGRSQGLGLGLRPRRRQGRLDRTLRDQRPRAAAAGRPPGVAGRDRRGDGVDRRLLEAGLEPAGGPLRTDAGQRPAREAGPRPQDRREGLPVDRRAAGARAAQAQLRARPPAARAARPDAAAGAAAGRPGAGGEPPAQDAGGRQRQARVGRDRHHRQERSGASSTRWSRASSRRRRWPSWCTRGWRPRSRCSARCWTAG
jgi:hypothetical protein